MPTFTITADGGADATDTFSAVQQQIGAGDTVVVEDGTYTLREPIELTSKDSGTTWQAAPGASVVISGGGRDMSLVTMEGVQDVAISGFTFTDTSGGEEYDNTPAAISIINDSSNIRLTDNTFTDVAEGVEVMFGANTVTVADSTFTDIGGHAIDFDDGSSFNIASKNTILRAGAEFPDAAAIEMSESVGNTITGNVIKDSPRHAIEEQNWDPTNPSGGNLIEFNEIENYMLETEDGGAIYMFGGDDPITPFRSTIQYNRIEGEANDFSWGIYLDDLVNGGSIIGNYVNGGGVASLMIHGGDRNEVTNNVFLNAEQYGITVQTGLVNPDDPILLDNIHHNIFAPDQGIFGASDARGIQFHDNIYVGGPDNQFFGWDGETFEEWQESGGDRGSIVLDSLPGFTPGGGTDPDNNPGLPDGFPGFRPDLPNFNPDWDPIFGSRNLNPDFDPNLDPDLQLGGDEEEALAQDEDEVPTGTMLSQLGQTDDEPQFMLPDDEADVADGDEIELDDDDMAQLPDDLVPAPGGSIPDETTPSFGRMSFIPQQDAMMLPVS